MTDGSDNRVSLAAQGDVEALKSLLAECGQEIWTDVDRDIGRTWQGLIDADDVMQVTYLEAFLQADRIASDKVAGFKSWLRRIARNNLQDAIKELQRKKRPNPANRVRNAQAGESYVSLIEVLGDGRSTPSRHVARQEAAEAIERMLARMPDDYAKVIRLYDLEGGEISDVAGALNRSPGAVHMLRARAHDRLRAMLGAETDYFTRTA